MTEIMKVEDAFSAKEIGLVISGVNRDFDHLKKDEIKSKVGKRIKIVSPDGKTISATVKDVAIGEFIIGKKNISIAIGQVEGVNDIRRNSVVYAVKEHVVSDGFEVGSHTGEAWNLPYIHYTTTG